MPKAFLLELDAKDTMIMKGLEALQQLEDRIEKTITVHKMTSAVLAEIVFDGKKEDATHEIKLDDHHRIVLTMKDGEFNWDQVCDHPECGEEEDNTPDLIDALAAVILSQPRG